MASTADKDSVRRLIYGGSTRTGTLSTADINWFVDNKPNVWLAASAAAKAEAMALAGKADKSVGDLRISYGNASANMLSLSKALRVDGVRTVRPYAGGISISDKDATLDDSDREATNFSLGVHDYGSSTG